MMCERDTSLRWHCEFLNDCGGVLLEEMITFIYIIQMYVAFLSCFCHTSFSAAAAIMIAALLVLVS
ncbi:unnamed protein product [Heterosigma akashiwo]